TPLALPSKRRSARLHRRTSAISQVGRAVPAISCAAVRPQQGTSHTLLVLAPLNLLHGVIHRVIPPLAKLRLWTCWLPLQPRAIGQGLAQHRFGVFLVARRRSRRSVVGWRVLNRVLMLRHRQHIARIKPLANDAAAVDLRPVLAVRVLHEPVAVLERKLAMLP